MSMSADHSWTGSRKAFAPVKHQEQCGSCWTPTTTCFESVWLIATGNLLTLSEQQLVNCIAVDSTCTGELMNNGFVFATKNAICTEANYSYTCLAIKGTCKAPLMEVSRGTEAYPQTASRL